MRALSNRFVFPNTLNFHVDGIMSVRGTALLAAATAAATAVVTLVVSNITSSCSFLPYVVAATFISFAYSLPPLHFKARAMGDLLVFVAFGPLPSAFVWHVVTGSAPPPSLFALAIPFGLWASAVLHRNNMRDADHDARIGITLAILLGASKSRVLFRSLLMFAVLSGSFAMMTSSPHCGATSSANAAAAAASLAILGMRLVSKILAREPSAQPQDVAAAAGIWGLYYFAMIYAVRYTCGVQFDVRGAAC
jgi:1,4-dihydroxy-2-naphthoate octaprenyltransferase